MALTDVFKTTTSVDSPLNGAKGTAEKPPVSEFITVQSLANFSFMTGAITVAWNGLQKIIPDATTLWVPYGIALIWGIISIVTSIEGLKAGVAENKRLETGTVLKAAFVAFMNAIVLAGAVVGTNVVTTTE